jgi:hypothetical protein
MKILKVVLSGLFTIGFPTCYHGFGVLLMSIIKWKTGCE